MNVHVVDVSVVVKILLSSLKRKLRLHTPDLEKCS